MSEPRARIIVPVFNALRSARRCLDSLRAFTEAPAALEIVDDASEARVARELAAWAAANDARLVRQEKNRGFVGSVNAAIARAREDFVVVLNSDTTLTPGWLGALLSVFDQRPRAALVTPLSNEASLHSFSIPPGWSAFHLAEALRAVELEAPDLVTASGFCMALRRSVVAELGFFDAAFGRGYGEESDLSMRMRAAGYEVLACPRAFVHHEGRQSFGPQGAPFVEHPNYALFMERWGPEYEAGLAEYRRVGALARLRARFPAARADAGPRPLALLRRMLRERGARYALSEGLRRGARLIRASARTRGLRATAREVLAQAWPARPAAPAEGAIAVPERSAGLERGPVVFLLEELGRSGGVKLVLQLADALLLRGWDVRVCAPSDAPLARDMLAASLLEPWFYKDKEALIREAPRCEAVIATLWSTASDAARLVEAGRARRAVYFVQDLESEFYREAGVRAKARASYGLIGDRVATSRWLAGELAALGAACGAVIPAGIDLDDFYPDPERREAAPRIAALARPGLARRGYRRLVASLRGLRERLGEGAFTATVFGSREAARELPWADVRGFVGGAELRGIYQAADIYFDASRFQAFGLPVVEAMACGAAVVAPSKGGVAEVVEDGESGLLVSGEDEGEALAALQRLVEDAALRRRLSQAGRARAGALSIAAAAERWAAHLTRELFREGCR